MGGFLEAGCCMYKKGPCQQGKIGIPVGIFCLKAIKSSAILNLIQANL